MRRTYLLLRGGLRDTTREGAPGGREALPLQLPSGKAGKGPIRPPEEALQRANELLLRLKGNRDVIGDSDIVAGWWVETHALGCRDAADQSGDEAWETHYELFEHYLNDGRSAVFGHADDGYFVTRTPCE